MRVQTVQLALMLVQQGQLHVLLALLVHICLLLVLLDVRIVLRAIIPQQPEQPYALHVYWGNHLLAVPQLAINVLLEVMLLELVHVPVVQLERYPQLWDHYTVLIVLPEKLRQPQDFQAAQIVLQVNILYLVQVHVWTVRSGRFRVAQVHRDAIFVPEGLMRLRWAHPRALHAPLVIMHQKEQQVALNAL